MQYRTLGRTGLKVSQLGFGTGGPSALGQSSGMTQNEQTALIRRVLDLGINFLDTSSRYGSSEEILGQGLNGVPRESYVLSTKWAHAPTWSPRGVGGKDGAIEGDSQALIRGVERSLRRLGTDYVDIMQFHGLRPEQYHEVVERFHPVMRRLQEQGKIRFIGFTTRFIADPGHEAALLGLKTNPDLWDTVMLKYGILNQVAANEILPLALEHGTGVINMAAVSIKLPRMDQLEALIADWKKRSLIPADSLPEKDPLGWLVRDDVNSVVAAGYKFAAYHSAISTVLTGTANLAHLEDNVAVLKKPYIAETDKQRLVELFGHIAEYA